MEPYSSFVICIACAALLAFGQDASKLSVEIVDISDNINVICGERFQLTCTMRVFNASCVWSRSGTVVKPDDKRYSFNSTNTKKSTICSLFVHEATNIDKSNWTCGVQSTDHYDGTKSKNISVDVFPYQNGTRCNNRELSSMDENNVYFPSNPYNGQTKDNNADYTPDPDNGQTKEPMMLYQYVSIGLSSAVILMLASTAIYCKCRHHNLITNIENKTTLHPIYEEIPEHPNQASTSKASVQPAISDVPAWPILPPKPHKKKTSVRIREIVDWDGYQVPLEQDDVFMIRNGCLVNQQQVRETSSGNNRDFELISIESSLPEAIDERRESESSFMPILKVSSNPMKNNVHSYENVDEMKSNKA